MATRFSFPLLVAAAGRRSSTLESTAGIGVPHRTRTMRRVHTSYASTLAALALTGTIAIAVKVCARLQNKAKRIRLFKFL